MTRLRGWFVAKKIKSRLTQKAGKIFSALQINLSAQASRTSITLKEFIESQKAAGIADEIIERALLEDLAGGGRIFGEFNRGLQLNLQGRLGQLSNEATKSELGVDDNTELMWVAALVNSCPDCESRHGQVDTAKNWELRGEPRSGWSVCRLNCQCQLVLASDAKNRNELKEPLKRTRRE